jgi:hypothetical protein
MSKFESLWNHSAEGGSVTSVSVHGTEKRGGQTWLLEMEEKLKYSHWQICNFAEC